MIDGILKHKWLIISFFTVVLALCVLMIPSVHVNYDLLDYLPPDSASTVALDKMQETFGDTDDGGLRVMVPVSSIPEALEYKERITSVEGVRSVTWLDDTADLTQPLSFVDQDKLEVRYKDGYALFTVKFYGDETGSHTAKSMEDIRAVVGDDSAMAGGAVNNTAAKQSTGAELKTIMSILIPVVLVIMFIATSSWIEPVLFLIVIGISILINMGTNALLGSISFVTQTAAAVLQLAVSMDYSIFLLHSFGDYRSQGMEPGTAMKAAMKAAFPSIIASGLTTIFGFAALLLMRFLIGADMGLVLAKGVTFSLLSVVFLLPVLALLMHKLIEKTHHRSFIPRMNKLGRLVLRVGIPVIVLVALIAVPMFLAQSRNDFFYGTAAVSSNKDSQIGKEQDAISNVFGEANQMYLLVPEGDFIKERALADDIDAIPYVREVSGYVTLIGPEIPTESVPQDKLSQLISNGYSRMAIDVDAYSESEEAFGVVQSIRDTAHSYYNDDYYLTGGSVNVYDMKQVVTADNPVVTLAAIIAIGLVLLFTFRSISVPLILLLVIETSIWINLSVPYFAGTPLVYIGYIIISAIQLGATVDYAILYTSHYMERRKLLPKKEAAIEAAGETFGSILTSASILISAGIIVSLISTQMVISQLGELIWRGAALSLGMVMLLLPNLLILCDKVIEKTTLKTKFLRRIEL